MFRIWDSSGFTRFQMFCAHLDEPNRSDQLVMLDDRIRNYSLTKTIDCIHRAYFPVIDNFINLSTKRSYFTDPRSIHNILESRQTCIGNTENTAQASFSCVYMDTPLAIEHTGYIRNLYRWDYFDSFSFSTVSIIRTSFYAGAISSLAYRFPMYTWQRMENIFPFRCREKPDQSSFLFIRPIPLRMNLRRRKITLTRAKDYPAKFTKVGSLSGHERFTTLGTNGLFITRHVDISMTLSR